MDEGNGGGGDADEVKRRLLDSLDVAQADAAALKDLGHDLVELGARDELIATHLKPVIQAIDAEALPAQVALDLTQSWEAHHVQVGSLLRVVGVPAAGVFASGSAAATNTSTSSLILSTQIGRLPAFDALRDALSREPRVEVVRELMIAFGLDRARAEDRSAVALLNDADDAISKPSGSAPSPTAVVIPLREAILATLAALLLRRPSQEKTGKASAKVVSIGRQCGSDGLQVEHFERLGRDADRLLNLFSSAKQAELDPADLHLQFSSGLDFLATLLRSLDREKMRPS